MALNLDMEKDRERELMSKVGGCMRIGLGLSICSKINDCTYLIEQVNGREMTKRLAQTYKCKICDMYSQACDLNQIKN